MSEIGQDVKIVGEKLLEHCDLVVRTQMVTQENFWTQAAKSILDCADNLFNEEEIAYIKTKTKEAQRKYFGGLVMEAVADMNSVSTGDLPVTSKYLADSEEAQRKYKERAKLEQEMRHKAEMEYMQSKYKDEQEYKLRIRREQEKYLGTDNRYGAYK
jgi:hypothetical protein